MIVRALIGWLAGAVVAIVVLAGWTSPSEAHAGHAAPPSASQVHAAGGHAVVDAVSKADPRVAAPGTSEPAITAAEANCAGYGAGGGSQGSTCCSNTCHAVVPTDLALPMSVSTILAAAPSQTEPAATAGPTLDVKRPPRSPAAQVG